MQLQQQPVIPAIPARQPIGTNALDPNEFSEFSPFTASESENNLALKSTAQTGNAFDDWLNATPLTSGSQNTGISSKNSQNQNLTNTSTTVNKEILDFPTGSTINSQFPVSNSANNGIKDNNDLNLDFSSNPVNQRLNAEFSEFLTSPQAFGQNQNDKK